LELERCRKLLDEILAGGPSASDRVLEPLDEILRVLANAGSLVGAMRCVHPSAEVRSSAEEAEKAIERFSSDLGLNRELYDVVRSVSEEALDAEGRRFLSHILRDFRRSGVDRSDAERARVRKLHEELVSTGQEFLRNISTDVRQVVLSGPEELEGLPEDYVRRHPPGPDGSIRITTDYPDYNPFMVYARNAPRRRELYGEFRRRAYPVNLDILGTLLLKRHELATLLRYPAWADYVMEDKMIRSPKAASAFIERVSVSAAARASREYELLLEEKRLQEGGAEVVYDWEKSYFEELVRTRRFQVDRKEIRDYFDYVPVKEGILALTEDLFSVRFVPVPDAPRWHASVEVLDLEEAGERVGRLYLDMHPREGKFKHAAMFPLVRGARGIQAPEAALVCNFPDPGAVEGPALLEHEDVVTFFHEFGHLLHHVFARSNRWTRFNGTATEWDFVEVPSQLYEEWAWNPDVLGRFARHHATGAPIPRALVERMREARSFGRALWARHQMFYASLSLEYHNADPRGIDTSALAQDLQNRYSLFPFVDDTYFHASFGHLDDYSALYYTYMWSLAIEKDMHREFTKDGVLSREAARRYRTAILEPGGSKDAIELVRDYLGRDYSFQAFEEWLDGTREGA
jgi:thimet oligopeptidase